MGSLDGRKVLITGGSSGIGEATALAMAAEGAAVAVGARRKERLDELAAKIEGDGGTAVAIEADITDEDQAKALVEGAAEALGGLDCLVNNAGWHPPHKPIDAFTAADFRDLFELNVMSVFVACRRALPHLRKTRGNIINMSSLVGVMGQLHATTYVATKGAVTATRRSEERRVGKECTVLCRSRWSPYH